MNNTQKLELLEQTVAALLAKIDALVPAIPSEKTAKAAAPKAAKKAAAAPKAAKTFTLKAKAAAPKAAVSLDSIETLIAQGIADIENATKANEKRNVLVPYDLRLFVSLRTNSAMKSFARANDGINITMLSQMLVDAYEQKHGKSAARKVWDKFGYEFA